jgi:hypothetical protein
MSLSLDLDVARLGLGVTPSPSPLARPGAPNVRHGLYDSESVSESDPIVSSSRNSNEGRPLRLPPHMTRDPECPVVGCRYDTHLHAPVRTPLSSCSHLVCQECVQTAASSASPGSCGHGACGRSDSESESESQRAAGRRFFQEPEAQPEQLPLAGCLPVPLAVGVDVNLEADYGLVAAISLKLSTASLSGPIGDFTSSSPGRGLTVTQPESEPTPCRRSVHIITWFQVVTPPKYT